MAKEMSYDVIGNIVILSLYTKNSKQAAKKLISEHKNIKTVMQKSSRIKGRLRKAELKFIAGNKTSETIHHENGCLMKLDVKTCYFSPRLSNDRLDIAKQVKPGEKVLVMFSGIAPYALVIAKNTKAKEVYAIELNKKATEYARENIKLNKLKNTTAIQGDVKKIIPKLSKKIKFDRIVMSRPQLKDDFLDAALKAAKKGTVIHFYDFLNEKDMPNGAIKKIETATRKAKKKFKIIRWKKALEIGPRKWRVRVDFIVL